MPELKECPSADSNGQLSSGEDSTNSRPSTPECFFPAQKYTNLITRIQDKIANNEPYFSLEFFPPRTANGAVNLISR